MNKNMKNKNIKHGHAFNGKKSKIYHAWVSMRQRCYNKNCYGFSYYGGRGIKVCKRWQGKNGFMNFLKDMGLPPTKAYSLDRIDVDGDYKPSNCKWATKKEQTKNRRRCNRYSSKFNGVYYHGKYKRWAARILIGYFETELKAHKALIKARKKLHND